VNALLSMKDVAGRLGVSRRCLYVSAAHIRTKALPFRQSDKGTGVSGVPPDRRYRSPPSPFGDQNEDTEPVTVATVHASGRSGEIEASSTPSEDFTWGIPDSLKTIVSRASAIAPTQTARRVARKLQKTGDNCRSPIDEPAGSDLHCAPSTLFAPRDRFTNQTNQIPLIRTREGASN